MNKVITAVTASCLAAMIPAPAIADDFYTYSDEQLQILQHSLALSFAGNLYSDDSVIEEYLNNLGHKITPRSRNYIFVELTPTTNAFASWGNIIAINMGLLDFMKSEAELAGVIAHEDAHISQRHFTRLAKGLGAQAGITIASILAALLSDGVSGDVIGGSIALQKNQEYTLRRRYEREADRLALNHLLQAGYSFDDYLLLLNRLNNGANIPEYARTHPASSDRIADLKSRERSIIQTTSQIQPTIDFWLIQERARSYLDNPRTRTIPSEYVLDTEAYGRLLSITQPSRDDIRQLWPQRTNWIIAITLAKALGKLGDLDTAIEVIHATRETNQTNLALIETQLQLLGDGNKFPAAKLLLASLDSSTRNNRRIAQAETKLWQKAGDQLGYRVALGYSLFFSGRLEQAKEQIRLVRAQVNDGEINEKTGRASILEQKIQLFESLPGQ